MSKKKYDADKTFVILTSIATLLIALAGTTLGIYDALTKLGMVGFLPSACYLLYDIVNAWAVYIDYKEDGTPLEWASWIVKGVACIALLFIGGIIGSQLMDERKASAALNDRTGAMQRVYNDCIAQNPKALATCRKLAESSLSTEAKLATDSNKKEDDTIKMFSEHKLFHYSPGFLAVFSLILLGLVKKLSKESQESQSFEKLDDEEEKLTESLPETSGKLLESLPKAYLDSSKLPKAYGKAERYFSKNGKSFYKLIPQSSGYQVRDHQNEYCGHIGWQAYEKISQDGITYDKIVKALRSKQKKGGSL